MKKNELVKKIHTHTDARLYKDGYVSIVDILMDLAYLKKEKYEEWRFGRVDYLERVCTCNLHEFSLICKEIRKYCLGLGCKGSYTVYKRWGNRNRSDKRLLRFSKSGSADIEKAYATHYVDQKRVKQLKEKNASVDTGI